MSSGRHVRGNPDHVGPVGVEELAEAALPGKPMHESTGRLLERELERLRARRAARGIVLPAKERRDLTGIALSGGGIRSATFALGVLQALARHDLLKRFDYLSSVSGGGYLGSSLGWWWSDKSGPKEGLGRADAFGTGPDDFPYGTDDPAVWRGRAGDGTEPGPLLLANLRKHGNYLTPGGGISALSGISVVLRAVILNLIVWLPLVTLLLLALIAGTAGIWQAADPVSGLPPAAVSAAAQGDAGWTTASLLVIDGLIVAGLFTLLAVLYEFAQVRLESSGAGKRSRWASLVRKSIEVPEWRLWAPITLAILFGLLLILPPDPGAWHGLGLFLLASGILATAFGLLSVVYALSTGLRAWIGRRAEAAELLRRLGYRMRRLFETWARFYLSIIGGLALIGALPFIASWLMRPALDMPGQEGGGGVVALIAGLCAAGGAFLRSGAGVTKRLRVRGFHVSGGFTATLAAALLLLGVLLIAHDAALGVYRQWPDLAPAFLAVLVVALASGLIVNANHISLGRFYRDRLMEAFMPAFERAKKCRTGRAPREADEMKLTDASPHAPYPIINTNVVLINAGDRRRCIRGGDNFILTPDYCGSNATGWCPTSQFMNDGMTLATAMAISGAAANPNTGVGGVGLARSRVVSVLMALLNMRLGYWVPHPSRCEGGVPNHFHPAFSALLLGYHESYPWQELTDGGHFENLGIYELIRRRVRLILVCDGGQDPGFHFEDLQTALRRIGEDFGAKIEFYGSHAFEDLIPAGSGHGYPRGLELARRGFAVARIGYPPDFDSSGRLEPGDASSASTLIYLTTTMVDGLALELRGYKGRNPAFPDQSTGDQFFDEDQFEAYRELGYRIAETMIEELDLEGILKAIQPDAPAAKGKRRAA